MADPRRCPKCRGAMLHTQTLDGDVNQCQECGREYPMVNGAAATEASSPAFSPPASSLPLRQLAPEPHWTDAARKRLAVVLRGIHEIEALRVEAENIHRGLTA